MVCAFAIFNRVAPFLMQREVTCNQKQYATKVTCHIQKLIAAQQGPIATIGSLISYMYLVQVWVHRR